jgi:hypothetical protein
MVIRVSRSDSEMPSDDNHRWLNDEGGDAPRLRGANFDCPQRCISPAAGMSSETITLRAQSFGVQFQNHSRTLLSCLERINVFPASLIEQWRDHMAALDVKRPRASLRLLAALSESYDEAGRRFKADTADASRSIQFAEQVRHIGTETDQLIRILERALAYEARK